MESNHSYGVLIGQGGGRCHPVYAPKGNSKGGIAKMHNITRVFIHRLDSSSQGTKGSADTVVLPEPTRKVATTLFRNLDYRLVNDDHSLLATFPEMEWDNLLEIRRQ